MKCLSIRNPWAWLIVRPDITDLVLRRQAEAVGELKLIENRTWHTKFRGRFLVHASAGMTMAEYRDCMMFAVERCGVKLGDFPNFDHLQRGGIIGSVELVDSVDTSDSPWYMGEKGFVLRDPRPCEFYPLKGKLGFFDAPEGTVEALQWK